MRVAVHQPNYVPWCGYFAKMFACDAFVFFDDTQLPQGRSYVTRAKVAKGTDGEQWLTVPVGKSGQPAIKDVTFAAEDWPDKHLRTLHHGYAKARHYGEVVELLAPHYEKPGSQLADFNRELIERIARYLGWTGTFHLASDYPSDEMADARLAQLTLAVGGSTYVSGAGGQNYQSPERFARAGLTLDVRTYQQVPYERSGWPFVPGLSVLDALLHLGRGARDALRYTAE